MSEFKVAFTPIKNIQPHPNKEVLRLEIATIYGFQVVVHKDAYKVGDVVCYCPIDAVMPADLESIIFPPDSKIKLHNSRVRQTRIQKFPSQGMVISDADITKLNMARGEKGQKITLEQDISSILGITKYEPPQPQFAEHKQKAGRKANCNNPLFHSYNGLTNIKWQPDLFKAGEPVVVQEKIHGTNARCGMLPAPPNTLLKKIRKWLGFDLGYEFCYGSNNVELTTRKDFASNFYGENIYGNAFAKIDAKNKIKPMEVVYGEIIGPGIQKGYDYGLKEHKFVLFDVKILNVDGTFKWLAPHEAEMYAEERGFDFVPILHEDEYNKEVVDLLVSGPSVYCPAQKVREGIVVKSLANYNNPMCASQKAAAKIINPAYLDDKNNTDFH